MRTYDSYKDSGIEWIGNIPSHWNSTRLKFIGESIIGIIYNPDEVVHDDEGLLVLRSSNIQDGKLAFEDCVFVDKEVKEKHITIEGDILLCARNGSAHLVGKAAYIDKGNEGLTFGAFMSIVRSNLGKYLYYFFNSQIFKAQTGLFSTSTINQLTSDTLNNMFISFPSDEYEQSAIASYLDRKTAEIDELIADKKCLLELYEEERTAVINQAVTKGLDPNSPMKDSGIEWLGEIPEHWEVMRLKYVGKIKYGLGQPPKQKIDGLPIIRATNVFRGKIDEKDLVFVDPDDIPYERDPILRTDDIIVVRSGAYTADSAIIPSKYDGAVTGYDMVFRCDENFFPKFIAFGLLSDYILKRQLIMHSLRAAQPHLNREELGETIIAVPSFEEQKTIAQKIETECSEIEAKKAKTQNLIDLLTEYRTALISEVVTGKVKVTD